MDKDTFFDEGSIYDVAATRKNRMKLIHLFSCNSAGLSEQLLGIAETSLTWSHKVGYKDASSEPDVIASGPSTLNKKTLEAVKKTKRNTGASPISKGRKSKKGGRPW